MILQKFLKRKRGILGTSVAMKNKSMIWTAFQISSTESKCNKLCAVFLGYPIGNHLSSKEIKDSANIVIMVVELKSCDIAYPNTVWRIRMELLLENVSVFAPLPFLIGFLRGRADALQSQFRHQLGNKLFCCNISALP